MAGRWHCSRSIRKTSRPTHWNSSWTTIPRPCLASKIALFGIFSWVAEGWVARTWSNKNHRPLVAPKTKTRNGVIMEQRASLPQVLAHGNLSPQAEWDLREKGWWFWTKTEGLLLRSLAREKIDGSRLHLNFLTSSCGVEIFLRSTGASKICSPSSLWLRWKSCWILGSIHQSTNPPCRICRARDFRYLSPI